MKKIFALLALTIVMSVCCSSLCLHAFDSSNKTKIKLPDEDKVVSFTEDFLKKIYPDKNLKISESNYIYNKNDEINGYCYNLTNKNKRNPGREGRFFCRSANWRPETIRPLKQWILTAGTDPSDLTENGSEGSNRSPG